MKELFVPYKPALKLKNLGFNEVCFGMYTEDKDFPHLVYGDLLYSKLTMHFLEEECLVPTWDQAFNWFRDKYKLYSVIIPTVNMYWTFKTMTVIEDMVEIPPYKHIEAIDYNTYEEARQACLEKLIEIINR